MDEQGFARVVELMGRMAGGDGVAAAFTLQRECSGALRSAVRRAAALRGLELRVAELDELVADVVLMLHDHASGWRSDGGALPWVWAERRVANIVDRHFGLFTDELDDVRIARAEVARERDPGAGGAGPGAEPRSREVLARLAVADPRAGLLCTALEQVATERDAELWLEMRVEESLGDRSPAATVAPHLGMTAEAARQQRRRIDQRLRRLVATDDRYAALAGVVGPAPQPPLSSVA